MTPAYSQSKAADQDLQADAEPASSSRWSRVPDYTLDRDGPIFRPHQRMGGDFASVAAFDHLKRIAAQHADRVAISDGVDRLTYSELVSAVESLSCRILAVVADSQAVGILLANSCWYPVAMLASMAAGRPAVPFHIKDPGARINAIATAARLSAVIGAGTIRPDGLAPEIQWIDVAAGIAPGAQPMPLASVSVDAPAIVLYTSGGSGRPRGIVNSQRSLLQRVQHCVDACHINSDDVFFALTGPATIAGWRDIVAGLLSGAGLNLLDVEAAGPRTALARMQAEGVTVVSLEPAHLRQLAAQDPAEALVSLRLARIGGETLAWSDIALLRKAAPSACLIQIDYSPAQTTGCQWFLPRDWSDQGGSVPVGWLLPGISFAIVDAAGVAVRPGAAGELMVRGPHVLLGHWDNGALVPAETDPVDPGLRIVATGNIARLDERNLLHIVGRKGRQSKVANRGESSPQEGPPVLFLLPGSLGYGPSLAAFATAMGEIVRVVPIRYPDLKKILAGEDDLAAMASAALAQIDRAQPEGHVRLLGHSLGGAVAFEVAIRLLAAGRSVRFLGILDTSIEGERSDYRETMLRTAQRLRTNRVTASRMACRALAKVTVALRWEARLARLLDRYTRGQFNATCFRIRLELQEVLRARAFFAWLAGERPRLPLTGTLFRCRREGMSQGLGWDQAFAGLDVIPIAGGHLDLVMEPHLAINHPLIEKAVMQSCSPDEARQSEGRPLP